MNQLFRIHPRDPVIARDGRPFGDSGSAGGNRQKSLGWPLPSTFVGAIRTIIGQQPGLPFDAALIARLKEIAFRGPLPVSGDRLFVPAPNDALCTRSGDGVRCRPEPFTSTDLPKGLSPVVPPDSGELQKFAEPPAWWSIDKFTTWALGKETQDFFRQTSEFRQAAVIDERTHVKILPESYAAESHQLFSTQGLVLDALRESDAIFHDACLVADVASLDSQFAGVLQQLHQLQAVGGERRMLEIHRGFPGKPGILECPPVLSDQLNGDGGKVGVRAGDRLCMTLAVPAIFANGWRPEWLMPDESGFVGSPPGLSNESRLVLRLTAVANRRWDAVSGWSYDARSRGPKRVKRMVPAGAVYFFDVVGCVSVDWNDLWLAPMSDDAQDRRDGFGLAMWGMR